MDQLIVFFGKLHLLFLHLPIGLLMPTCLLALWSHWKREQQWIPILQLAVTTTSLLALFTAFSGWWLAAAGTYPSDTLFWHRWLGIATALASIVAYLLRTTRWLFVSIYATTLLLLLAGHYGGSLTHGDDFFALQSPPETAPVQAEGTAFESLIYPILQKKCISCHQPSKRKGDLLLDSYENLLLGGSHGPVLVPNNPDSSILYQRLRLPGHDEYHMPPKGKAQLSPQEIEWVRRWIELGATTQLPASALLNQLSNNPFPNVNVAPADPADIQELKNNRIAILSLGEQQPWLAVSLTGRKDLQPEVLQLLRPIADQITHLDLAHTNCSDELLSSLKMLKHLSRLHLSNTMVTSKGIAELVGLSHLRYLNLHQTKVDDSFLDQVELLKRLKELYVWGTLIQPAKIASIKTQFPDLRITYDPGSNSQSTPLTLVSPSIFYSKTIFDDTLQVKLEFPFKGVALHYTLDQTDPTSSSPQYNGSPLVLDQSATVRVIAAKPGWENSPVAEATFAKRKHKPIAATLSPKPSEKYPGKGGESLIDNLLGLDATDPAFLGFEGSHATAVLDFGKKINLTRAGIHYLENNGSWIFAPSGLELWASTDKKSWIPVGKSTFPVNTSMQNTKTGVRSLALSTPIETQYLKMHISSPLQNPAWHPGKGQKCWIFIDEVLIE